MVRLFSVLFSPVRWLITAVCRVWEFCVMVHFSVCFFCDFCREGYEREMEEKFGIYRR
jgi:hypothetical protein